MLAQADGKALTFDNYELIEEVGQGANAAVVRARDPADGSHVALKLFLTVGGDTHDEHSIKEFTRESEMVMEIVHPNIVRLIKGGELHAIPYLVIEFVDGINMAQYLEQCDCVDPYETMKIGEEVCDALDYVWSGFMMIHRDIKPQNVMLTADGTIKVCDFGMIVPHEQAEIDLDAVEGTPYYISPECITEGSYQDNRSDIYSLGATLYHLIAGAPPFDYNTVLDVVEARVKEPPPDIRDVKPDVPEGIAQVLLTMMAQSPEDRYVTAAECLEDMRRARHGERPHLVDRNRPKVNH